MDWRLLVSLSPRVGIPNEIGVDIGGRILSSSIEIPEGLNACIVCKKEGHLEKNYPKFANKKMVNPKFHPEDYNPNAKENEKGKQNVETPDVWSANFSIRMDSNKK